MRKQEEKAHFSRKKSHKTDLWMWETGKKVFNKSLWEGIECGFGDYHGFCFKLNSSGN